MRLRWAAPCAALTGPLVPILVSLLSLLPPVAPIARAADPAPPPPTPQILAYGGEIRLRGEGMDNAFDLSDKAEDGYSYYRMRYRVWADARPRENVALHFRFGSEYRWGRGEKTGGVRDPESKVSLDNGWVELRRPGPTDLTLRFGRMDLQYGEGFLILDGTPADGSSSQWFDAISATIKRGCISVDLLAAKMDEEGLGSEERDEDLYGIHGSSGPAQGYVFHRVKRKATPFASGVIQPKLETTAIGARFARLPESGPHLAAEATAQLGTVGEDENDRRAFGGYVRTGWTFPIASRSGVELGALYLGGDDPATDKVEGWDTFYADWPKYSELLLYTFLDFTSRLPGNSPGTWTDLVDAWAEGRWIQTKQTSINSRLSLLWEAETGAAAVDTEAETDSYLGMLVAVVANHALNPNVSTQVVGEYFSPADRLQGDDALYGRWQITARF